MKSTTDHKPKISIVVTARHDDHGGGFLRRMQTFTNALLAQCDRHRLRAELIVVEWNPMPDRDALYEVLSWPETSDYCSVRFIEVPQEIHGRYHYSANLGLYQMIAKNVGFRRARADFCLATNIDILFSDDLIQYMASGELKEKVLYRVDRYDIPEAISINAPVEEQLQYCRENLLRNNERDGTRNFLTGKYFPTYVGLYTDSTRMHFNACGDFTLMSKNDWFALRGYPEFDMYSAHIDSLMLLMTYHAGIRQEILPDTMQTYHIEHASSMIAEKASKLFKDLDSAGVPQVKVPQIEEWAKEMNRTGRPLLFNGPDWGHALEEFKDTYVIRALWDMGGNGKQKPEHDGPVNPDFMSVIVAGEKNSASIEGCLGSLASQTLPATEFEVLAVLNEYSSHDRLIEQFRDKMNLRVIHPEGNGLSAAYAAGVTGANGRVVLFINHDSIADTNMLYEHWLFHKNNPPRNRDIWAYLNIENSVMVGQRLWGGNLSVTPLMEFALQDQRKLKDGDRLEWWHFTCDNLSCNRDFIVRYGNFDELFREHGGQELGYRLSRRKMKMIYNSRAKCYLTVPLTLEGLQEKAFKEGQFAYALSTKYRDQEVNEWSRMNGAGARVDDLKETLPEILQNLENASGVAEDTISSHETFHELYRSQGLVCAEHERAGIMKRIFTSKLCEQARKKEEKTVLIISETLPLFDIPCEDDELFAMIKVLAKRHPVTLLSRNGVEKGKYIEALRQIGVSVFYDREGLREQAVVESKSIYHASTVDIQELLTHRSYDLILLHGIETACLYINPSRDFSPQSALMIHALESGLSDSNQRSSRIYLYDEADIVVANRKAAHALHARVPDLMVRTLPDIREDERFESAVCALMNELPVPQNKELENFRVKPEALSGPSFWSEKTEMAVIFVMNDNSDASNMSLESFLKYSDPGLSRMIIAFHEKRCSGLGERLERESRYYFKYDNEKERDVFIDTFLAHCPSDYAAVVESTVMVCPHWERKLIAHVKKNPDTGIVTARASEYAYKSMYDFERDAHRTFEKYKGKSEYATSIEVPCLVMNQRLFRNSPQKGLRAMVSTMLQTGTVARAQDTHVFHMKKGLREKKPAVLDMTIKKRLSIIMSASRGGESLSTSIKTLCSQEGVDYEEVELIVVYRGTDVSTAGILKSIKTPCSYDYHVRSGLGSAAAFNYGVKKASGEYILFVSGDAAARDNILREHLKTHMKHQGSDIAVLGHISLSGMNDSSPLMRYLSKNPRLPFASPLVYNYSDITNPQDAGHFYMPNVSLKRSIFNAVGTFDEEMPDGWAGIEFGSRFSIQGYKVVYTRKPLVVCDRTLNLEEFLDEQAAAGSQFAVMAYRHPKIWNLDGARSQCLYYYYEKHRLYERVKEIAGELEDMTDDARSKYKYAGTPLLEKCYYILANYCFARGIYDVITGMESTDWLNRYAQSKGVDTEDISNENRAYEMLFESYWHIGNGDYQAFSRYIEQSSDMLAGHPSAYYAAGLFYFNLTEYRRAEAAFEQGIEKRRNFRGDSIFPAEDEALYHIWLAMACIPQSKYKKAATVLENLIAERMNISEEQEALVYKCLSLSYRGLGDTKRADFCRQESDRLGEDIRAKQELQCMESIKPF